MSDTNPTTTCANHCQHSPDWMEYDEDLEKTHCTHPVGHACDSCGNIPCGHVCSESPTTTEVAQVAAREAADEIVQLLRNGFTNITNTQERVAAIIARHCDARASEQPSPNPSGLEACPFCGGRAVKFTTGEGELVGCDNCEIDAVRGTMEEAIKAWNTRTPARASQDVEENKTSEGECRQNPE